MSPQGKTLFYDSDFDSLYYMWTGFLLLSLTDIDPNYVKNYLQESYPATDRTPT